MPDPWGVLGRVRRWLSSGPRAIDWLVCLTLTLLVWGFFPRVRGIRFAGDDVNFLYVAWVQSAAHPVWQFLSKYPPDPWTRALAFWPFVLATQFSAPILFSQLFYAAVWLFNGWTIAHLTGVLTPQWRLAPFVAGALTVTATSDFLTNSVVYAPHLLGAALFFEGTAQLLRSGEPGRSARTAVSAVLLLAASSFTAEYTYPAVPLLPILAWLHARRRPGSFPRAAGLVLVSFLPAAATLGLHLLRPGTHAASVLAPPCSIPPHCSLREWLALFASHVWHNVWPVRWAFRRIPPWYDAYAPVFGPAVCATVATVGAVLAAAWYLHVRRPTGERAAGPPPSFAPLVAIACLAAAAVNAALVNPGGEFFVRSHFVSRGWTAVALALVLTRLAQGNRWQGAAATAVFVAFVFFGVWGGVERQSYLLGYAINERRELASLLDVVPGFAPSHRLVIVQPPGSPLMAANNPNTVPFLYGSIALWNSVIVAANSPFEASTIDGDADGRIVIHSNTRGLTLVDPAISILAFYSPSQRRFVRLDHAPAGLLRGSDRFFDTYHPAPLLASATSVQPRVIMEFLTHPGFPSSAPRKPRFHRTFTIWTVAPAIADRVQVDWLTPYAVTADGGTSTAWLGRGRSGGLSALIWAEAPVSPLLSLEVAPRSGPPTAAQHLAIRLTRPDGFEQSSNPTFEEPAVLRTELRLATGANLVELWLEVPPDRSSSTRSAKQEPLAFIRRVRLDPG